MTEDYSEFHERNEGVPLNTTLTNAVYDKLKFVAQVLLPAIGALYFGLAQIWGFPNGEEVVGTIAVLDTFLGVALGLSARQYTNATEGPLVGFIDVEEREGETSMMLNFPGSDPHDIKYRDKVTFKVRKSGL
jgi:hypothetical protein